MYCIAGIKYNNSRASNPTRIIVGRPAELNQEYKEAQEEAWQNHDLKLVTDEQLVAELNELHSIYN